MPTEKKTKIVEEYTQKFKDSKSIFLADFSGINVANTIELRRSFRKSDVEYYVIKNTLAKRSLQEAGIDGLNDMLVGMTAFAFSTTDAVAPIRVIKDFNKSQTKDSSSLVVKGCVFEGRVFGPDKIDVISSLPAREALISQFVGMLQSPLSKVMAALQGTGQKLVGALEQVKKQKS